VELVDVELLELVAGAGVPAELVEAGVLPLELVLVELLLVELVAGGEPYPSIVYIHRLEFQYRYLSFKDFTLEAIHFLRIVDTREMD